MRLHSLARATVAAGVLVVAVAVAQSGAGATEHERVTLGENDVIDNDYPAIPGSEPYTTEKTVGTGAVQPPTPEECRAASFACDVIPVTIEPPGTPGAEYYVRFTLSWEAEPDPSGLTALQSNDLDMYLWHDPPREMSATAREDDPATEEDESAEFHPGSEFRLPEVINFFSDEPGDFLLLVANGIGLNTGYTLTIRYFPSDVAPPTGFAGVTDPRPAAPAASPAPPPASRTQPTPVVPAEPFTGPGLTVEPLADDPDFDSFGSLDLDDELAAPSDVARLRPASRAVALADSPSSLTLVLWLVLAPVAVALALAVWLVRRRPGLLHLS